MKSVLLNETEYNRLAKLKLSNNVYNTEGNIKLYNYKGKLKVLKEYYINDGFTFINKIDTLVLLDKNRSILPNEFVIPEYLVLLNSKIIGSLSEYINNVNLSSVLLDKSYNYEFQIRQLKRVGKLLEKLDKIRNKNSINVYINDLHESNFIIDTTNKKLRMIDVDSCKIGNNSPFPSKYLSPSTLIRFNSKKYPIVESMYSQGYVSANKNSDLFCYIIMILNYLSGENISRLSDVRFYNYLSYLESIGINKELIYYFSKILSNEENENPYYLLDSLSEEDIKKSKIKCRHK